MPITIQKANNINPNVFFEELNVGDPFLYPYNNTVHVKVHLIYSDGTDYYTAIDLTSGEENYFDSKDVVIPIKASLTYSVK